MVQGQTALDDILGGQSVTALDDILGKRPTARKVRPPPSTLEHVAATALGNLSGGIERSASMLRKIGDRMVPDAIQPKPLPGVEAFFDQSPQEARGAIQSGLGVRESPDLQIKPGEDPGLGDEKFWKTTVPGGIGDLASFALQTMALGPLGTAAGLGAKSGAFASGAAIGALAGSEESFQRTLADTGDEGKAWEAAMYGGLLGTTEGIDVLIAGGLGKTLGKVVKGPVLAAIDKKLGGLLKEAVFGGAVEGLQEGSQSTLQEFVARRLDKEELSYLQDLKASAAQFPEGGKLGLVLGVLLGGGGAMVRGQAKSPESPDGSAPEPLPDLPAETVQTSNLLSAPRGEGVIVPPEPLQDLPEGTERLPQDDPSLLLPAPSSRFEMEPGPSEPIDAASTEPRDLTAEDAEEALRTAKNPNRITQKEHDEIDKAARRYFAERTPAARIELARVAEPRGPEAPREVRPSLIEAARNKEFKAAAEEYATASERKKLDLREFLQDNLKEYLTPTDIADIAAAKPGKAVKAKPTVEVVGQRAPSLSPQDKPANSAIVESAPTAGMETRAASDRGGVEQRPSTAVGAQPSETVAPAPSQVSSPPAAEAVEPLGPDGQPATSTKNRIVQEEANARDLSLAEDEAVREFGPVWEEAGKKLAEDPSIGERVVKGEPVKGLHSDTRNAVLLREQITAELAHDKISDSLVKAQEANDTDAIEALTEQKKNASDRLVEIYNASKREGTEAGRGLNARRMMAFRNYSLAAIETQARIAKGGEQLTSEEHRRVEDLSKRLIAAEKALDEYETNAIKRVEQGVAKLAKQPAARPETVQAKKARVLSFLDAKAAAAEASLKSKRGRAGSTPFDPGDIADVAWIAAKHLAHGLDAAAQLVKQFGEAIKPHLDEILKQARAHLASSENIEPKQRAQETRLRKAGEKVKAKIEAQDFSPPAKRVPIPLTPEAVRLKTNLEELKKEYAKMLQEHQRANRTTKQKVKDAALETLNLPKQALASADLSAVLRQGIVFSADPSNWKKLATEWTPKMLQSAASERKFTEIDVAVREDPTVQLLQKHGMEVTSLDGPIYKHEEHMRSSLAEKIPVVGKVVRGSNRAFSTFLNLQRAAAGQRFVESIGGAGNATPEQLKAIASAINVMTGRGAVGKHAATANAMANALWSPRLLLSRFQLLAGQPMYRGDAATRKAIAGQYARTLAGMASLIALGRLAGADVEDDPRSSDFGKLKFGDTRVDVLGGLAQVSVLTARTISGETKTGKGDILPLREPIFGDGPGPKFGAPDMASTFGRFARSKLSPTLGLPLDLIAGENAVGEPVTPADIPKKALVPLSFQDIAKTMEEQGVPRGTALWILGLFGAGVNTYEPRPSKASR